jgi:hypothetical protein
MLLPSAELEEDRLERFAVWSVVCICAQRPGAGVCRYSPLGTACLQPLHIPSGSGLWPSQPSSLPAPSPRMP